MSFAPSVASLSAAWLPYKSNLVLTPLVTSSLVAWPLILLTTIIRLVLVKLFWIRFHRSL